MELSNIALLAKMRFDSYFRITEHEWAVLFIDSIQNGLSNIILPRKAEI